MKPDRSPWALNSAGSSPAIRQRFFKMRLTDCGLSGLAPIEPSFRTSRKIGPDVISATCIHSCRATAARPAANTKAPCPAVVVFVRPSAIRTHGTVGDVGSLGRSLIGIGRADLGVPQSRDLAAPPSAGGEGDQEDGPIAKVDGSRSAAGGQETVEDIAGDGLAALALRCHAPRPSSPDGGPS